MNSDFFWYAYIVIAIIMFGVALMHLSQGAAGRAAFSGVICAYFVLRLYMMQRSSEGGAG